MQAGQPFLRLCGCNQHPIKAVVAADCRRHPPACMLGRLHHVWLTATCPPPPPSPLLLPPAQSQGVTVPTAQHITALRVTAEPHAAVNPSASMPTFELQPLPILISVLACRSQPPQQQPMPCATARDKRRLAASDHLIAGSHATWPCRQYLYALAKCAQLHSTLSTASRARAAVVRTAPAGA
jgi:hypothetical protein